MPTSSALVKKEDIVNEAIVIGSMTVRVTATGLRLTTAKEQTELDASQSRQLLDFLLSHQAELQLRIVESEAVRRLAPEKQ